MTSIRHFFAILAMLAVAPLSAGASTVTGPSFPPDGGTVDFAFSGSGAAEAGGANYEFTNFAQTTGWIELYWGPSSAFLPTAGLDGIAHSLTLSSISGTTATWSATTDWTDPFDSTTYNDVPVELRIDISFLGGTPWLLSTGVAGLDPGPGTGIGAVVDNSAGADFTANVQFLADLPTDGIGNFIALNDVQQLSGGQTNSSITGGFYSVVPEPGTALLLGAGVLALSVRKRA